MKIMRKFLGKSMALVLVIYTILMSAGPAVTAEAAKETHECVAGICEPYTWSYCDNGDGTHAHAVNSYIRCISCKSVMDEDKYRAIEPHDYGTTGKCACGALQPHVHKAVMCAVVSDVYTPIEGGMHWLRRIQVEKCSCGEIMKTDVIDIDSLHDFNGLKCIYCGHQCETVETRVVSETIEATEAGHYRIQSIVDITCCGAEINGRCLKSGLEGHSKDVKFYEISHPHFLVEQCSICLHSSINKNKKQNRDDCGECMFEASSNDNRNGLLDAKEYEEVVKELPVPEACKGEEFVKGSKISETVTYVDLSSHARVVQYAAKCKECGGNHATDDSHRFSDVFLEAHTPEESTLGTSSCAVCGENLSLREAENLMDTVVDTVATDTGRVLYYELKDFDETIPKALNQVVAGNYVDEEDITLVGTIGQILASFTYVDTAADIRDSAWNLSHWENSLEHFFYTVADGMGIVLPAINCVDELLMVRKLDLNKNALKAALNSDVLGDGKNTVSVIKNGDKIGDIIEGGSGVIELSKNNVKHIKKHIFEDVAEQAKYLTDEQLASKLADVTFFTKEWSHEEVVKYTQEAYNILRSQGKIGLHSVEVNGEIIKVFIKDDGAFDTAYGVYKYTVDDFR